MLAAAIGRVEERGRRRRWAAERPVVANIGPEPSRPGLVLGEHRDRRIVGVDALGGEDVGVDGFDKRRKRRRAGARPSRPASRRRD